MSLQDLFDLGDAVPFGPQLPDLPDPVQAGFPLVAPGQVVAGLLKGQHPFLRIEFQGAVPHVGQPHQLPNGDVLRLLDDLQLSLTGHTLTTPAAAAPRAAKEYMMICR